MMATNEHELDPDVAGDQLLIVLGAANAGHPLDPDLRRILWRLLPFVYALREVGRAHPGEVRAAWRRWAEQPGPFGLAFRDDVDLGRDIP